ncbi:transmembrane anchor protein [Algihabitans albus]|uniref:transmembrane anchor protein n=1 Tax=Algihabitans albus TaxID=2164067 RepID=UPI0035D119AB
MTNDVTNETYENAGAGHIHGVSATPRGLVRATLASMAAASAILTLFWLPSEYGVDPTGLGRVMGLTQMGEIKQQLYAEAADEDAVLAAQAAAERVSADPALLARLDALESQVAAIAAALGAAPPQTSSSEASTPPVAPAIASPTPEQATPAWRDEVSYTLAPTQGIEIKLVMSEGARAEFEWTANGAVLNFDTHGDGGGQNVTYEQGRGVPDQSGELVAAFDGNHGWFWRNRTDAPVSFTLRTRGDYDRMIAP